LAQAQDLSTIGNLCLGGIALVDISVTDLSS